MRRGSSVVERSPEEAGVVSSILTRGTKKYWAVSSAVEQFVYTEKVRGSIPLPPTRFKKDDLSGHLF